MAILRKCKENAFRKSERGFVYIFAAVFFALAFLCIGVSYSVFIGLLSEIHSQTAADAASLAGSSELCATDACWRRAREVSLSVLKRQEIQNSIGKTNSLSGLDNPELKARHSGFFGVDDEFDGYTNNNSLEKVLDDDDLNISITIERGIWQSKEDWERFIEGSWDTEPNKSLFESFEAVDKGAPRKMNILGEDGAPLAPPHVFANALRVEVSRKEISAPFLGPLPRIKINQHPKAVSLTGGRSTEGVPVAPVAIPLCNLLDENGEYRPEDRQGVDLLVTSADWNCPIGESEKCRNMVGNGLMPSFDVEPVTQNGIGNSYFLPVVPPCLGDRTQYIRCLAVGDGAWHFSSRYMEKTSSNFAVYAVPGTTENQDIIKNDIRLILKNDSNPAVFFGQKYQILHEGLKEDEVAGDDLLLMYNRIRKLGLYPQTEYSSFHAHEPSLSDPIGGLKGLLEQNWHTGAVVDIENKGRSQIVTARNRGACPSTLSVPTLPLFAPGSYAEAGINKNVWIKNIPVIYNFQNRCTRGANETDIQSLEGGWHVVGFVTRKPERKH